MGSQNSSRDGIPEINYNQTMEPIVTWRSVGKSVPIAQKQKPIGKGNILITRFGGTGDLIMLTNALKALKESEPQKNIYLATEERQVSLFKGLKFLKDVIGFEKVDEYTKNHGFEDRIDLLRSVEPKRIPNGKIDWDEYRIKNRVELFEDRLGVRAKEKRFGIVLNGAITGEMKERLSGLPRPLIIIQVGALSYFRTIPYDMVLSLIDMAIYRLDSSVVLLGETESWSKNRLHLSGDRILNLVDQTSMEEMVSVISLADLVIAGDSGPSHIAGALGKPTLVLIGNIPFELRYSYYPTVRPVVAKSKPKCVFCYDVDPTCCKAPYQKPDCLASIKIEDVFEACMDLAKSWRN